MSLLATTTNPKVFFEIIEVELNMLRLLNFPFTLSMFIWITVRLDSPIYGISGDPEGSDVRHLYYFRPDVWSAMLIESGPSLALMFIEKYEEFYSICSSRHSIVDGRTKTLEGFEEKT